MWGQHLKLRGRWWHYNRAVPREFCDLDHRRLISFSLKTANFSEAKLKAAQISIDLERKWSVAQARGFSLASQNSAEHLRAAAEVQTACGFAPQPAGAFSDIELLDRLRQLILLDRPPAEQRAVLGLVEKPSLSTADAFDRFW